MTANKEMIVKLEESLNKAATALPKVTPKKMFGCHALFADGNVFALVWKHGRIGVKLTAASDYEKLMGTKGAEPWKAGPMQMKHWVLLPETYNDKATAIKPWLKLAHTQAMLAPKKAAKKTKKAKN